MAIFKIKPQKTTTINTMTGRQIYAQLGGNDFAWISGCTCFVRGANFLSMKLPKNNSGATHLKIQSNGSDTFDFIFVSIKGKSLEVLQKIPCVYWGMIKKVFNQKTGLRTD